MRKIPNTRDVSPLTRIFLLQKFIPTANLSRMDSSSFSNFFHARRDANYIGRQLCNADRDRIKYSKCIKLRRKFPQRVDPAAPLYFHNKEYSRSGREISCQKIAAVAFRGGTDVIRFTDAYPRTSLKTLSV